MVFTRLLILTLVLTGCGGNDAQAPSPPGTPAGATATVSVGDNFFQPTNVSVRRGAANASVTWTWSGRNPHNVTFDAGGTNSATQTEGTFSRTFTAAGTFSYICTIHGRAVMSGTVVVE